MPELIALVRICTPDGLVEEGNSFVADDENAEVLVARGDAAPPKPKRGKKAEESSE